jgi:hypothetical protein
MAYLPQIVSVPQGGTGLGTLTAHSIQLGNGTSSPTQLAVGATGTVLQGSTGADPAFTSTPTLTNLTLGSGNALSNFQDGTYIPVLSLSIPGTSSFTHSVQVGRYIQIGSATLVQAYCALSAYSAGTGSGQLQISLPFTTSNTAQVERFVVSLQNTSYVASTKYYSGATAQNSNQLKFQGIKSSAAVAFIGPANVTSSTIVIITGIMWIT